MYVSVCSVASNSLWPKGPQPARLLSTWNFPSKNIGSSCHFLFQRIYLTQGLNPSLLRLLHWQADCLALSHWESPEKLLLLLLFSHSVVSDSLWPHGQKHARIPCASISRSLLKLISIESMIPSNHLILCCPLLLLPSIFLRSSPAKGSFSMSWLLSLGSQSTGTSASAANLGRVKPPKLQTLVDQICRRLGGLPSSMGGEPLNVQLQAAWITLGSAHGCKFLVLFCYLQLLIK